MNSPTSPMNCCHTSLVSAKSDFSTVFSSSSFPFSALTLLVGQEHLACKKTVLVC